MEGVVEVECGKKKTVARATGTAVGGCIVWKNDKNRQF